MLNNTAVKRLKSKDKVYRVLDADGLYVEVRPTGRKFWRWRYVTSAGKSTMVSLGEYPDVMLADARAARDVRKKQLEYGSARFSDVAAQWFAYKNYSSVKNATLVRRRVELYLLPRLGQRLMSDIKPADILPVLKSIEASGRLELAKRVRTIASQIFRYGVVNLLCEYDPAAVLVGATKQPVVRHMPAIVDERGFADLLRRIDRADMLMPTVKYCLQVAPYVMLRSGEIRKSSPDHIDFDRKLWTLPAEFMKMKKDLQIPLHDDALTILKRALEFSDGKYIFSGSRPGRPLSENTLNQALRSLGYCKDDVVFHGFRSSFSTLGREVLRFEDDLIERQLAHVEKNTVRAAYDRSFRLEDRRVMMQRWGDYVHALRDADV